MSLRNHASALLACGALAILAGCATPRPGKAPPRPAAEVRAQLEQLLPAALADRRGWAADIQIAFEHIDVPASTENLCAALAVTEQESGYDADPPVAGLGKIARREIDQRAARLKIPSLVVATALKLGSPDGRSYATRIAAARTEQELSAIYEDMIDEVPLGRRLFSDANPVRTGGPMQVRSRLPRTTQPGTARHTRARIRFATPCSAGPAACTSASRICWTIPIPTSATSIVLPTSMPAGTRAATPLSRLPSPSHRECRWHWTCDRPARHAPATMRAWAPHETAVRSLAAQLDLDDVDIRRALEQGNRFEFEHPMSTCASSRWPSRSAIAAAARGDPAHHAAKPEDHPQADHRVVRHARAAALPALRHKAFGA